MMRGCFTWLVRLSLIAAIIVLIAVVSYGVSLHQ